MAKTKDFRITFPILKTEELADGRMIVRGIATSDAIDKQGERLLFDGSVAALTKWLETGPAVREQHDPLKAIGSGLNFTPLPNDGAIAVEVFVSAAEQGTQTKLREKVLRAFSIGGRPLESNLVKEGGRVIKEIPAWEMEELSLVDRPANPDCVIAFAKTGSILSRKGDGMDEDEQEKKPPEGEGNGKAPPPKVPPQEGQEAEGEEGKGKPAPAEEDGEEGQESGKITPPAKPPAEGEKIPLSDEDLGKIVASVTDAVLAAIKEQTEAVKTEAQAQTKAVVAAMRKNDSAQITVWDIRLALDCLDMLCALLSYEEGEKASGANEPAIQVVKLKAAKDALSEFIVSESGELLGADDLIVASARPVHLLKSLPPAPAAVAEAVLSPDATLKVDSLTKAVADLKADIGEVRSFREAVDNVTRGIEKVLSMPVPGRAPMKFASASSFAAGRSERSETERVLENMLAKADTLSRPGIERELNMLRAQQQR